jgi:hypothetical protein
MRALLIGFAILVVLAIIITPVSYLTMPDTACMDAWREDRATHACWAEHNEWSPE